MSLRRSPLRPMSEKRKRLFLAAGFGLASTFAPKPRRTRPVLTGTSDGEVRCTPRPRSGTSGGPVPEGGVPQRRPRGRPQPFIADAAEIIRERSGGWCELQIPEYCLGLASQLSHRGGRQMGGRHGAARLVNDRPSNALHGCSRCHLVITEHPGWGYTYGWLLKRHQDPAQEPVLYRGARVYLSDDGQIVSYLEAGA